MGSNNFPGHSRKNSSMEAMEDYFAFKTTHRVGNINGSARELYVPYTDAVSRNRRSNTGTQPRRPHHINTASLSGVVRLLLFDM